jgi:glycosyltransferase involved in cell wall biosynthesis
MPTLAPVRQSPAVPHDRPPARPVRVCFVVDHLSRAGTETQLLALIRTLDRSRVVPSLVLLDGEGESSRALEPDDCPVLRLGVRALCRPSSVRAAYRLRRFWRDTRPDVVQVYFLDSSYFAVPLACLCGVRAVVRVRNNLGYWLTPKHRLLNRLVNRLVDVSLTNSASGRDALIAADGLAPGRVAVIENGVDLDRFPPGPASGAILRVGCVANLRPVKNIDGLMRVAARVLDHFPGAVFEVAGEGDQRAALERLHADIGLGDRFVLRGSVADVPGFLRSVGLAVLPSHSEGMSNALLEYMAAGRAVVATDVGANAAVLGGAGVVVPPGDEQTLAAAISDLLADPDRAARLGAVARRRVEAEYSRDAMRRRFEDFYERLAAHNSR